MAKTIERVKFNAPNVPKILNVCAYARVSSGKDAMLHSLEAQVRYYSEYIQSHHDWHFCGVYADEAMTGTKADRENFQLMLQKCRDGEIDLILCKSISRFARNTVTLLETVRELKNLGVGVIFEEQNINSLTADGELMLTILASFAQEESLSVSENQKWRIRKNFQEGKVGSIRLLGYKRTHDGSLEIIPDEAKTVQMIFEDYAGGHGKLWIANKLNDLHIPTINGKEWLAADIDRILRNEKYAGNMLLQKTFRKDHISKQKVKNTGQLPQYYVEESHPAIINSELFETVQTMLKNRAEQYSSGEQPTETYPFTGIIKCGCCGKNYRRKTTVTGVVWCCATYNTKGKKHCPKSKMIPEKTLIEVSCDVLKMLNFDVENFKKHIQQILVPEPNFVVFNFKDGRKLLKSWADRSRAESWTPEMKKKASERSKKWHDQSQ